jgi:hypothetical protein
MFAPAQLLEVVVRFLPAHLSTLDRGVHTRPGVAEANRNDCGIEFGWISRAPDALRLL